MSITINAEAGELVEHAAARVIAMAQDGSQYRLNHNDTIVYVRADDTPSAVFERWAYVRERQQAVL